MFCREQKHPLRRIISNKMEIFRHPEYKGLKYIFSLQAPTKNFYFVLILATPVDKSTHVFLKWRLHFQKSSRAHCHKDACF